MLDLLIITGASRGIGENIANKCSTISENMIRVFKSNLPNQEDKTGCNVIDLQSDIFYFNDFGRDLRTTIKKQETLLNKKFLNIGIVLCAGTLGDPGGIFDTDLGYWTGIYNTNVLGNLSAIKACKDNLDSGAKLKVVFFAGGGAAYGNIDFSSYALSKVAVVRAVENVSMEFVKLGYDASIISLAPGAVDTDMLKKVIQNGGYIKTKTDISEPTNFVFNFMDDKMPTKEMNGRFFHVRDDILSANFSDNKLFMLRRIE